MSRRVAKFDEDAYLLFLALIEKGEIPACIPIEVGGKPALWTMSGIVPDGALHTPQDGLAAAMLSIKASRAEAIKLGLHPLN